ncbi:DoxX family protein [Streptomyces sp. NPDC060198]|uniref:DoxX family protein n=1 Tax=Streptomyces sp. NPDC060198 TaxID=3347070 RepID=UPI00364DD300
MFVTLAVVAALMTAVLLASAWAKFTRPTRLVDQMTTLGLPYGMLPFLGIVQIAGAGGLVVGLWWGPLGIAAATGLALYFAGAVATHLRVKDFKGTPPAISLAVIAAVLVALRVATL